jgi:hypothetical protein
MASYVNSNAVGLNNGTSWADAFTSISSLSGAERLTFVASNHTEVISSSNALIGTPASPHRVISCDETQPEGSEVYKKGVAGQFTAATAFSFTGTQSVTYHGIWFAPTTGINVGSSQVICHDCNFVAASQWTLGAVDAHYEFHNCKFRQNGSSTLAMVLDDAGRYLFRGCDILAGGTAIDYLFQLVNTNGGYVHFEACDWSGIKSGGYLLGSGALPTSTSDGNNSLITFSRCKLPTSGGFINGTPTQRGFRVENYNVDSTNTIYNTYVEDQYGTAVDDTSVYRAGTYDGTNPYSILVTPAARTKKWLEPMRFKLSEFWADANKTLTVELTYQAAQYDNSEAWLEIEYPDATTGALGKFATTKPATVTTAPTNLDNSAAVWTNPKAKVDKISHTVTGGQAGVHTVWACFAPAAANREVYVDPRVAIA